MLCILAISILSILWEIIVGDFINIVFISSRSSNKVYIDIVLDTKDYLHKKYKRRSNKNKVSYLKTRKWKKFE